jgi:hypothetical protein
MISIDVRNNYAFRSGVWAEMYGRGGSGKTIETATIRALNRGIEKARTNASREIRKVYNIKHGAILKVMSVQKARKGELYAQLIVGGKGKGRRLNLIEFSPRAVNPWNIKGRSHKNRGGGVSVQIKVGGPRTLIPGAFIAASTKNNYQGGGSAGMRQVWRRHEYFFGAGGNRWNQKASHGEDVIVNLRSLSIPQAFANKVVIAAVAQAAVEVFEKTFNQQVEYLGGMNRG